MVRAVGEDSLIFASVVAEVGNLVAFDVGGVYLHRSRHSLFDDGAGPGLVEGVGGARVAVVDRCADEDGDEGGARGGLWSHGRPL